MPSSVLLTAGVLAGITSGVVTVVRPGEALAAAVAAAALALLAPSRLGATVLLVIAGCAAAAAHGAAARDRVLRPPLLVWFDEVAGDAERLPALATIDGVLVTDAAVVDDGVRLLVAVDTVSVSVGGARVAGAAGGGDGDGAGWRRAPGRVQLHVAGEQAAGHARAWTAGRRIRAPVTLRRPQLLLNFGGSPPFWQRLRRPFALTGGVKSAALVEIERGAWFAEAAAGARWLARDAVTRFIAPRDAQAAAIVTAILIGDRAGLDDDVERRLQVAGTYHVIAISGGNVALLTGLCYFACRLVMRSPRGVALATLLTTVAYGSVVVGGPSVTRAVVAASLYLVASGAGLVPSPLATLRTAACLLAIADPIMTSDVGAWLSFGATLGILLFAAPIANVIAWEAAPRWCRVIGRPVVLIVAATIAAELVLIPIAAGVFGRVTLAGLALNLVAIPAMAAVQIAGLAIALLGPAWSPIGEAAAAFGVVAARALVSSSALTDVAPWLSWRVPAVSTTWIAAYYVAGALAWWPVQTVRRRRAAAAAAATALAVIVAAPAAERAQPAPARMRISMLDVGQGDAILVQLPHGQSLLVDAGGGPGGFDIGTRVVTPAAAALGVRGLTWLALTHGDRDHIGGAFGVTEDLAPLEIWEGVPVPRDPELGRLRRLASSRGLVWRTMRAGAHFEVGPLRIDALHPPEPDWERQRVRNDDSLVLRIRYGHVDVVLAGDAGAEFEQRLPDDLSAARIRILKAGHHGSRTSTSDRLVQAMRPHVALVSAGRGNLFGHPTADVLARLRAAGTEIFRTDRDGAVSLETDGATVRVLTALGRRWTISVVGSF